MLKRLKFKLLNWLLKDTFCAVTPQDVIRVDGPLIFLGNEQISDGELQALASEAKFVERTRMWTVLTATLAEDARKRMFEKAQSFDDMFAGKMLLYAIDLQVKIMKAIEKINKVRNK